MMDIHLRVRKIDGTLMDMSWKIPGWFRPIVGDYVEIVILSSISIEELDRVITNSRGISIFDEENGNSSLTFTGKIEEVRQIIGKEIEFEVLAIASLVGGQTAEEVIEIIT